MFREVRRNRQKLPKEDCIKLLDRCTSGVLALSEGDDGYPYAVPLSYIYDDGKIFFHCAKQGHKIDAVLKNPKASFCIIARDQIVPERFTTYFKSVIAFGFIRILEDETQIRRAIEMLAHKYSPAAGKKAIEKEIECSLNRMLILEFQIEHLSGKQAIELANE